MSRAIHAIISVLALCATSLLACAPASLDPTSNGEGSAQRVTVNVQPPAANVEVGGGLTFSAETYGTINAAVTWRVEESGGGAIDSAGQYVAPNTTGTYHIVASSVEDSTASATATVTVGAVGADGSSAARPSTPNLTVGAELFVAPAGTGTNCTAQAPCSITAAQTRVRDLRASSGIPTNCVAVTLFQGTYLLSSTLPFTAADSGTDASHCVIWRADPNAPGGSVRVSGGVQVTGWTRLSQANAPSGIWARIAPAAQGKMWFADVPGTWSLGSMSDLDHSYGTAVPRPTLATFAHNGIGQRVGRYPKLAAWNAKQYQWGRGTSGTSAIYYTGTAEPADRAWAVAAGLPDANKPWITYLDDASGYTAGTRKLSGVSGGALLLGSYSGGSVHTGANPASWQAYNLLEEVTTAGEYWIDRANRRVYFYPPSGADPGADTYVARVQTPLVSLTGASYIVFDGIVFENVQGDLIEFDPGAGTRGPYASPSASHHITVRNSTLRNTGGVGVLVRGSDHILDHNALYAIGASAIALFAAAANHDYDSSDTSVDHLSLRCTVSNSDFHDVGLYVPPTDDGHSAILLGGTEHVIAHNYFHDFGVSAITIWSRRQTITYNRFLRVALERTDGGAVYSCRFPSEAVDVGYNIFAFIPVYSPGPGGVFATYADDGTGGWNLHHNIYYAIGNASLGGGDGYAPDTNSVGATVIKGINTLSHNVFSHVKFAIVGNDSRGLGSTFSNNQGDTGQLLGNTYGSTFTTPGGWTGSNNVIAAAGFLSTDPADTAFLTNSPDGTFRMTSATGGDSILVNQVGILP